MRFKNLLVRNIATQTKSEAFRHRAYIFVTVARKSRYTLKNLDFPEKNESEKAHFFLYEVNNYEDVSNKNDLSQKK